MKRLLILICSYFFVHPVLTQEIKYTHSSQTWDTDSLGNHRVLVRFQGEGNVAKVVIPWRRRDSGVEKKRIIVEDPHLKRKISNVISGNITFESGEVYFEPLSGKGNYYIYFMPYKNEGRIYYPQSVYLLPEGTASQDWISTINYNILPNTIAEEMQSINLFHSNDPMEIVATEKEMEDLIRKNSKSTFLVFPEDRAYPVRMKTRLPLRWIEKSPSLSFAGKADRGEFYSFQLAVLALKEIENMDVTFSDLRNERGNVISGKNFSCLNTSGVNYDGLSFKRKLTVKKGEVQSFWCLLEIPSSATPGKFYGRATIRSNSLPEVAVSLQITVSEKLLQDGGIDKPALQTRLHWLNSTMAQANTVISPYTPLTVHKNRIDLLGRRVYLRETGFPSQILSYFTKEMTAIGADPSRILSGPVQFNVFKQGASNALAWKNKPLRFIRQEPGTVSWQVKSYNTDLEREVSATMEFDGFVMYTVKLTALKDVTIEDISLVLPFTKESSKLMMGLGQKGGLRPQVFDWKWNVEKMNQDGAWIGNVNMGLQYSLRDENYVRPLNTNFYLQKPLLLPTSWGNKNRGGIRIRQEGSNINVTNYSGERYMKKGDTLFYNFTLLITPFHPINTDFQWATRFYHKYAPVDTVNRDGATVINIHHATPINPWINYPFIEWKEMKNYVDEAHRKGLKVKIYNTVRELSNRAYETFPMRSLGHEIYSPGEGGGFSWLQEHLGSDYIAAWFVPKIQDAAIVNSGMSRWHNYYVEGMNWLVNHVGIDGIYLDDVAFDRITMKRIKRVLTQNGHPGIIDLHSANQFNPRDGYNNSANLYLEHFPYINRLWFGEYFDYENNGPDFFLTEVSGIPFGLMGEMLEKGGNPWRGMLYGMTNRMPYDGNDPSAIWRVWDAFGMEGSRMIGYWSDHCPVTTNNKNVLTTAYIKNESALISIASWDSADTKIRLNVDWKKLGINAAKARIIAPGIKNFQPEKIFLPTEEIPVEKGKGWLLIITES